MAVVCNYTVIIFLMEPRRINKNKILAPENHFFFQVILFGVYNETEIVKKKKQH